jgi:hypothetical protein
MATVHCPPNLAADVIDRGVFALERKATPDADTARALMRLARRVELDTADILRGALAGVVHRGLYVGRRLLMGRHDRKHGPDAKAAVAHAVNVQGMTAAQVVTLASAGELKLPGRRERHRPFEIAESTSRSTPGVPAGTNEPRATATRTPSMRSRSRCVTVRRSPRRRTTPVLTPAR